MAQPTVHQKYKTPLEITTEALEILGDVRARTVPKDDQRGRDQIYTELGVKHSDFATTFPIVLRWIVHNEQFNKKAFLRLLAKIAKRTAKDRHEFILRQADYVADVWRGIHPRADEGAAARYRKMMRDTYIRLDKEFVEAESKLEEEKAKFEAEQAAQRRRELQDLISAAKAAGRSLEDCVFDSRGAVPS